MFMLLLVVLLQVGVVIVLTVGGHLVPHLSLLPCLRGKKKKKHVNVSLNRRVPFISRHIYISVYTCAHRNMELVDAHRCKSRSSLQRYVM